MTDAHEHTSTHVHTYIGYESKHLSPRMRNISKSGAGYYRRTLDEVPHQTSSSCRKHFPRKMEFSITRVLGKSAEAANRCSQQATECGTFEICAAPHYSQDKPGEIDDNSKDVVPLRHDNPEWLSGRAHEAAAVAQPTAVKVATSIQSRTTQREAFQAP